MTEPKEGFEEKMMQLSNLSEQMDSGNLSLDEMLVAFETGIRLYRECQNILKDAEAKVNLIIKEGDATIEAPFQFKDV